MTLPTPPPSDRTRRTYRMSRPSIHSFVGVTAAVDDDGIEYRLDQHTRHSPDGHAWGYAGSGPSQLALDILWDFLGHEPEPALYQSFKDDFVANVDGDSLKLVIYGADIANWLALNQREARP